jgi:hypothetical protein
MEWAEARVRKFFQVFLHVFFGLKVRDIEEIKSRVKPLNASKKESASKKEEESPDKTPVRAYLLYWYKSTNTDAEGGEPLEPRQNAGRSLLALLFTSTKGRILTKQAVVGVSVAADAAAVAAR